MGLLKGSGETSPFHICLYFLKNFTNSSQALKINKLDNTMHNKPSIPSLRTWVRSIEVARESRGRNTLTLGPRAGRGSGFTKSEKRTHRTGATS